MRIVNAIISGSIKQKARIKINDRKELVEVVEVLEDADFMDVESFKIVD